MSNDSKPVFTDDREKQDRGLGNGDGGVDSDDSPPDIIIGELVAEGKAPFSSISLSFH
jgi:hypothetical protein